ncbi:MAG: exodeoxyribonuclease VII large subunit [Microthrixaceae bacterium]
MAAPTFTVGELVDQANLALTGTFPGEVWVEGEIHNKGRPSAAGHTYFSLVEARTDPVTGRRHNVTLNVALFNKARDRVNRHLRRAHGQVRMDDGVRVRLRGTVGIYPGSGSFQLVMVGIDPTFTLGSLAAERAALLGRLEREGLLGTNATRTLSPLPLRVALIASRGSAAEADFLHELELSGLGFRITRLDTRVQGVEAPDELALALSMTRSLAVDAVVLIRGGGARTDLAAFDAEVVARAIAGCAHPVLTGIGHEVDTSVADQVAHGAYKTPTAVAGALIESVAARRQEVEECAARLGRAAESTLLRCERSFVDRRGRVREAAVRATEVADARVVAAFPRVAAAARRSVTQSERSVQVAAARVPVLAHAALRAAELRLDEPGRRLGRVGGHLDRATERLDHLEARVSAADPVRLLARGYAMVHTAGPDTTGRLVRGIADVTAGDRLGIRLVDGSVAVTADEVTADEVTAGDPALAQPAVAQAGDTNPTPTEPARTDPGDDR